MKLVIMHSRRGMEEKISLSLKWLIVAACITAVSAVAIGAALQRSIWSAYPDTIPLGRTGLAEPLPVAMTPDAVQALASRVGELQASVLRLDGLGRRVAEVAGLPDSNLGTIKDLPEAMVVLDDLFAPAEAEVGRQAASELERQINLVQSSLNRQADYFSLLDLTLTRQAAVAAHLPTTMPIEHHPYLSSSYGWRRNPINGQMSMHQGLDFSAPMGTPIRSASGGVVRTVTRHPGYGNMVEIDHGEGLLTRYAHAQVILVKEGQLVTRGQAIARVGSTGLSTGSHLHFEVLRNDKPLDPRVFLADQPMNARVAQAPATVTTPGVTWRPRLR